MTRSGHHVTHLVAGLALLGSATLGAITIPGVAHAAAPATYMFNLDSFDIYNTMARHNDTDFAFFSVRAGNQLYGPYERSMGDLNNGHYLVGLQTPSIPIDANTPVLVSYQIVNNGHNPDVNTMSNAISSVLGTGVGIVGDIFGIPGLGGIVTTVLQTTGGLVFANCDGTPVSDGITSTSPGGLTLNGADLLNLTNGVVGGRYAETRSYTGPNTPVGCGSNSRYSVSWSVTNTYTPPPPPFQG